MIWHFIHHWVYEDLWIPVWPNWFAGAIAGVLAYTWGKREIVKFHKHLDKNHEELKAHINRVHKQSKVR